MWEFIFSTSLKLKFIKKTMWFSEIALCHFFIIAENIVLLAY